MSETLDYIIFGVAEKCEKHKKKENCKNKLISVVFNHISCLILTYAIYMTILGAATASLPYNLLGQPEIKTCAIVAIYKVDC